MTIYDIFEEKCELAPEEEKKTFFSTLVARLFFLALLVVALGWGIYTTVQLLISLIGFKRLRAKSWLNFKRFLVCSNALFVSLFSPALGVMFACSYFLMYDKAGIDEVVPAALRDQFKGFFSQ